MSRCDAGETIKPSRAHARERARSSAPMSTQGCVRTQDFPQESLMSSRTTPSDDENLTSARSRACLVFGNGLLNEGRHARMRAYPGIFRGVIDVARATP